MIYYIGDTHFGHRAIVRYDRENANGLGLPVFDDVAARDEYIISKWNSKVGNRDEVYVDGDFSFYGIEPTRRILHALNGRKHVLMGNHDGNFMYRLAQDKRTGIEDITQGMVTVHDGKRTVIVCHYPIMNWEGQHRGAYHIYAHVHATPEEGLFQAAGKTLKDTVGMSEFRAMNCGCMLYGYEPVTLDEMARKYRVGKAWSDRQTGN